MLIRIFFVRKWLNNLQNSGDPDQMPHYVASDLVLHFLPIPLQGFPVYSGLKSIYMCTSRGRTGGKWEETYIYIPFIKSFKFSNTLV